MYKLIEGHYSNGKRNLPRLSSILAITNDYGSVRRAVLDETAEIGTSIHAIIRRLCEGDIIHEWNYLDARICRGVAAYDRFREIAHYKPDKAETVVVSEIYEYGCTEDASGYIPDGHIVNDWKATVELKANGIIQLAAIVQAHEETFVRDKIVGGFLVRLDKDTGRPHPIWFSRAELNVIFHNGFLNMRGVWECKTELNEIIEKGERWQTK